MDVVGEQEAPYVIRTKHSHIKIYNHFQSKAHTNKLFLIKSWEISFIHLNFENSLVSFVIEEKIFQQSLEFIVKNELSLK